MKFDWKVSVFLGNDVDLSGGEKVVAPLTEGERRYLELTQTTPDGHDKSCRNHTDVEERMQIGGHMEAAIRESGAVAVTTGFCDEGSERGANKFVGSPPRLINCYTKSTYAKKNSYRR